MGIIKTKKFSKWVIKSKMLDSALVDAAREIDLEMYEANYGGGVLKKRVSNKGRGKSSSARTIVAFKKGNNCYFVFGFEKSDKDNIFKNEEKALKLVAKTLLSYLDKEIDARIEEGNLIEVNYEQDN